MKTFTDSELEKLLCDTESDRVERKGYFKGDTPKRARQAVCAFANDLPDHKKAGILFVGANDDGSPSKIPVTDELLRSLADMKTDGNILPLPALTVEKRLLKEAGIAVVTVMPSDFPPVKYDGRIWIRTSPRRSIANHRKNVFSMKREGKTICLLISTSFQVALYRIFHDLSLNTNTSELRLPKIS